ncbi:MAG: hypothetical protein OWS03_12600 [Alicyclobacillaceae bacterium]|nr:hypothetical protein [Alicyclobacillaceae bacterium]
MANTGDTVPVTKDKYTYSLDHPLGAGKETGKERMVRRLTSAAYRDELSGSILMSPFVVQWIAALQTYIPILYLNCPSWHGQVFADDDTGV